MEVATESKLTVTRRVVINKVFEGSLWDTNENKFVVKPGYKQIIFSSMLGPYKHQITDEIYEKFKFNLNHEYDLTYSLREYVAKLQTYCCYINEILDLKPVS